MPTKQASTDAGGKRASSTASKSKAAATAAAAPPPAADIPADNGAEVAVARKKKTEKRDKVVRDSFTMPKHDFEKIAALKAACLKHGIVVKKSELLRAGLAALSALPEKKLLAVVASIETVKTGRPTSH
jgi:hypothetical protein